MLLLSAAAGVLPVDSIYHLSAAGILLFLVTFMSLPLADVHMMGPHPFRFAVATFLKNVLADQRRVGMK